MDSIKDILVKRNFDKPDTIEAVLSYISVNFNSTAQVKITNDSLIIIVRNSSLASSIRLRQRDIVETCQTEKLKLVIRTV